MQDFGRAIRLIKHFKFDSVFFRNLIVFTLIILLPITIIVGGLAFYYRDSIAQNARANAQQNHRNLLNRSEQLTTETERMYYLWASQIELEQFFAMKGDWQENLEALHVIREIRSMIQSYTQISECVEMVRIYSYSANYILSSSGESRFQEDIPELYAIRDETEQEFSKIIPVEVNGRKSFAICYDVIYQREPIGNIAFYMKPDIFRHAVSDAMLSRYSFLILDRKGHEVYHLGSNAQSVPECAEEKSNVLEQNGNTLRVISQADFFWLYFDMDYAQKTPSVILLLFLCVFLSLLLSFVLALVISFHSYAMVEQFIYAVNGVETLQNSELRTMNEISWIRERMIHVVQKSENLSQELMENFSVLKDLQMKMLQMQFTPHFLFNVLQALSWQVIRECGADSRANELISLTSDLLSVSLDTGVYLVSIEQEKEYGEKYLKIAECLNNYNFDVIWDVDSALLNFKTLKLSLQCLLENAVKHGIKHLRGEERGYIKIKVSDEGEQIVFRVENNGASEENEKFFDLKKDLKNGEISENKKLGLRNINKRIKLIFGEKYGCGIALKNGVAFAEIRVPKIR